MSEIDKKKSRQIQGRTEFTQYPTSTYGTLVKQINQINDRRGKILKDVKKAVEDGRPLDRFGTYLKAFQRNIHVKEGLLFIDNKLIVPAALRSPFMSLLHKTHPGQFGMKSLVENIWWPHLYREIYYNENSCIHCIKAGKIL